MLFEDLLDKKDGLIKGPFGGDIKKSLFVKKSKNTVKVYEQGTVLNKDFNYGNYYISNEYFKKKLSRFEIKSGDLLLTGAGTLGELIEVPKNIERGVINQALLRIRLNKKIISTEFFKHYFKFYIKAVIMNINGDSVIPNLPPLSIIKKTKIKLPNFDEQIKISKFLSSINKKIENNKKINDEIIKNLMLMYQYWFIDFEFPSLTNKSYKSNNGEFYRSNELKKDIPKNWKVKKFSEIVEFSNEIIDPNNTPNKIFKYYDIPSFDQYENYSLTRGNEIKSNKYVVKKNDILFSKLNPWFKRIVYSPNDTDLICSTEFIVLRAKDKDFKNFIFLAIQELAFLSYCTKSATGTSNSHKRIHPDLIKNYKIAYDLKTVEKFNNNIKIYIKIYENNFLENIELKKLYDWLFPNIMNKQISIN